MTRWVILILAAWLGAAHARGDGSVTLLPVARVEAGTTLTIGSVCTLADASELAAIPIFIDTSSAGRFVVSVDDIKRAITSNGARLSGLTVRGDQCTVVVRKPTSKSTDDAPQHAEVAPDTPRTFNTIRSHVRAKLEQVLAVPTAHLDLRFDASEISILDRSASGLTVDVQPIGLGRRTPVRVTLYSAEGSIEVHRVQVGVRILREVARASRVMGRGTTIQTSDLVLSREWLGPDEPHVEPTAALGQRLRRSIDTGEMLTTGNVEPPIVIERGDIVMVHVVSGSVVLRRESRALESGRTGQRIRLEPIAGGTDFRAEIEGPGRAVIVAKAPRGVEAG